MSEVLDARTPVTWERAVTEVTQCRKHLTVSRRSLELALNILDRLNGHAEAAPTGVLRDVLRKLEETEVELRSIEM